MKHFENSTFAVRGSEGESFYVRVNREGYHTRESVCQETVIVRELSGRMQDRLFPEPVAADSGEYVVTVDGRHCTVTRTLPGRTRRPGASLSSRAAFDAGRLLRELHEAGAGLDLVHRPRWDAEALLGRVAGPGSKFGRRPDCDWVEQLRSRADWGLAGQRWLGEYIDELYERVCLLGEDPKSTGFIHGDPNPTNFRFRSATAALLDFDDCGWGHRAYDLAMSLFWILMAEGRESAAGRELVRGYGEHPAGGSPSSWSSEVDLFVRVRLVVLLRYVAVRDGWAVERWARRFLPNALRLQAEMGQLGG